MCGFRFWSKSIAVFRFWVIFRAFFRFFIDPNAPIYRKQIYDRPRQSWILDSGRISGTEFLAWENSRRRRRKMSAVFSGDCSTSKIFSGLQWDYVTFRMIKMNIILKVQCIHYVINKNWMMKVTFEEQVMYLIKANFLQRVAILRAFI